MSFSDLCSLIISRSICVDADGIISFFLSNIPFYIFIISSLSICGWTFRFSMSWLIVNSGAVNTGWMYPFKPCFSPDICPKRGLLDHMVVLVLGFKEPAYCSL